MKLHFNVNMNLSGQELLRMLFLMESILIEIENYYSLSMKLLDVRARKLIMCFLQMQVVKDAIQQFVYLK